MDVNTEGRIGLRWLVLLAAICVIAYGCSDPCELAITTKKLPGGIVNHEYSAQLTSECGGDRWFLMGGTLPPGISLSDEGRMSGVPTTAGDYSITIGLEDFPDEGSTESRSREVSRGFVIHVIERYTAATPTP